MSNVLKAYHINLSYSQPFLAKFPDEFASESDGINGKKEKCKDNPRDNILKATLQIQKEKERMAAEVKAETEKILRDARAQAEEVRQKTYDSGYKNGYNKGKDIGYAQGKREAKIEYEKLLSQVLKQKTDLEKQRHRLLLDVEEEIVNLSLSIAKKIVSHELDIQPEKVLSMVRYAIGECRAEGKRVLKVSPQDYDKVTNNKNTLCDSSNQGKELVIEKDERLSKGDCVIETDTGLVDAKIDTQLQIIREVFMNVGVMGNYDA